MLGGGDDRQLPRPSTRSARSKLNQAGLVKPATIGKGRAMIGQDRSAAAGADLVPRLHGFPDSQRRLARLLAKATRHIKRSAAGDRC